MEPSKKVIPAGTLTVLYCLAATGWTLLWYTGLCSGIWTLHDWDGIARTIVLALWWGVFINQFIIFVRSRRRNRHTGPIG